MVIENNDGRGNAWVVSKAKEEVAISERIMATIETDRNALLHRLAGECLRQMKADPLAATAFLRSKDPKVRCAALIVLADCWQSSVNVPGICEYIALNDEDLQTVVLAVALWCECVQSCGDSRAGRILATLVYDESRSADCRIAAYNGLFQISGMPVETWPNMKRYLGTWVFPDHVDWRFVDSFLK